MVSPSMSSSRRSVSTRSYTPVWSLLSASAPVVEMVTSYPSISRIAPIVMATLCSSSTTSRLPLDMLPGPGDRQRDTERRAAARAAAEFDRSPVRLNDALGDPQSETSAFLVLGRKERLEDVWKVLFGDAVARIADLDVDRLGHQELRIGAVRDSCRYVDGAALRHGLLPVKHQVQEHLFDLI